jgi:hypothetical protein
MQASRHKPLHRMQDEEDKEHVGSERKVQKEILQDELNN